MQCSQLRTRVLAMQNQSKLLVEPPAHPALNLVLRNEPALVCLPARPLNTFPNIDGVLNVLKARIIRKRFEHTPHFLFRSCHHCRLLSSIRLWGEQGLGSSLARFALLLGPGSRVAPSQTTSPLIFGTPPHSAFLTHAETGYRSVSDPLCRSTPPPIRMRNAVLARG